MKKWESARLVLLDLLLKHTHTRDPARHRFEMSQRAQSHGCRLSRVTDNTPNLKQFRYFSAVQTLGRSDSKLAVIAGGCKQQAKRDLSLFEGWETLIKHLLDLASFICNCRTDVMLRKTILQRRRQKTLKETTPANPPQHSADAQHNQAQPPQSWNPSWAQLTAGSWPHPSSALPCRWLFQKQQMETRSVNT